MLYKKNGKSINRANDEVEFGKKLARLDPELTWGWGSPAGKIRARRRADLIIQNARIAPESRVLEIGCGTGVFTEMFAKTGAHLIAMDISPELVKKALEKNLPYPQIQFIVDRFENWETVDRFDAIIGSSVLHHLDVELSCRKIFTLLKHGGVMVFAEPNMLNPQIFLERKFRKFFSHVSPDETAFVRRSLSNLLEKIGFRNIHIFPFDWLHPRTPVSLIPLVQFVGCGMEKIFLVREFAGSLLISAQR